jgi:hypothetical protein
LFYATPEKLRNLNINLKMEHQVQEIDNSDVNGKIKVKVYDLNSKKTF